MDAPREYLVIFESTLAGQALEDLKAVAKVTQVLEPRLALISAGADAGESVRRIHGVLGIYVRAPATLPSDLRVCPRSFWALA